MSGRDIGQYTDCNALGYIFYNRMLKTCKTIKQGKSCPIDKTSCMLGWCCTVESPYCGYFLEGFGKASCCFVKIFDLKRWLL